MNSKPHRNNSDFQLKYFLAGSCKTPDAAWCLLYEQKISRESVLKTTESQQIKRDIMKIKAERLLESDDIIDQLEGKSDLIELEASQHTFDMNREACRQEVETTTRLMDELEPLRKYGHLSVLEAAEAIQEEEWLLELKERCENFMITQGSIPHDHFHTMRCHPQFKTELAPFMALVHQQVSQSRSIEDSLKAITQTTYLPRLEEII